MTGAVADLVYAVRSLPNAGHVLHLGAHPDDEDVGLLTWCACKLGQRIVYWSATRGEASQNRIGTDRGASLGVYRTWESLQARAIDHGEVLYGPFIDYGFSKSGEEALEIWGRDRMLREIVRAIRSVQPQIVISRWSGSPDDGHGHHQAVGAVVREAFEAAADAAFAPELAALGLMPWRPAKLYRSMGGDWQPGQGGALGARNVEYERRGLLRIDAGESDPVTGRSYQERAFEALNCHRSQALGFPAEPGPHYYYYERWHPAHDADEQDFYDGLDPGLCGIADAVGPEAEPLRAPLAAIGEQVRAAVDGFRVDDPRPAGEQVLPAIMALRTLLTGLGDHGLSATTESALRRRLEHKLTSFNEVAARCLGIRLECAVDRARAAPGQSVTARARVWLGPGRGEDAVDLELEAPAGWKVERADGGGDVPAAASGASDELRAQVHIAADAPLSCPYWLRGRVRGAVYSWPDDGCAGEAFDRPPLHARATIGRGEQRIELRRPATFREGFAGGHRQLGLSVIPAMAIRPRRSVEIVPRSDRERRLPVQILVEAGPGQESIEGAVRASTPQGWNAQPQELRVSMPRGIESRACEMELLIPPQQAPGAYFATCEFLSADGSRHASGVQAVRMGASGIPRQPDADNCIREAFVTFESVVRTTVADVQVAEGLRFGYVRGADDEVPECLAHYDIDLQELDEQTLRFGNLHKFDALAIGPNAYLQNAAVADSAGRLLEYAHAGGTLIVQHHGYAFEDGGFAPYEFHFSRPHDRVTRSQAPVTVLEPEHAALNFPNRIGPDDFEGWVHDRGMYFCGHWDPRYRPLLVCNDPGESPKAGGLLFAPYGRGAFVYCAYSLFRQLPAGVEGAHRLFANLLSLPEARVRQRIERLEKLALFAEMNPACLRAIARISSERWLTDGSWLAQAGEHGDELFVVLAGEVDVLSDSGPKARRIAIAGPGESIGEFAVLADVPRTASLRAQGDVHLMAVDREDFRQLMHQEPEVADRIIRMLVSKLITGNE